MSEPVGATTRVRIPVRRAPALQVTWVIAWRHIKESLHNRSTYLMAAFFLLLPLALVIFTVRPALAGADTEGERQVVGGLMAFYLLMAGLLPSNWAVGIAAGAFAAEKEQGSLTPLLATPASNTSIFVGKVIGAVIPSLTLAVVNVAVYLVALAAFFGPASLRLLPVGFSLLMFALLPGSSLLGASLSSMISARVNTEQVANQYSSIILTLITVALFFVILRVPAWGLAVFAGAVALIYLVSIALVVVSAHTWRREELMARREA